MRALCVLLLAAPLLLAGEADPVTAHIPADSTVFFRLPSLDRLDAMAQEVRPLLLLFAGDGNLPDMGKVKPSALLLKRLGITPDMAVRRDRPVYLADHDGKPLFFMTAAEGTAWEGKRTLLDGNVALLRERTMCIGPAESLAATVRGEPTELLEGDAVMHVFLDELIRKNREDVDATLKEMWDSLKGGLPERFHGVLESLAAASRGGLDGVGSLDYALVLKEGKLESIGLLRTLPRSKLRAYLKGVGAARANDLMELLPDKFFIATDSSSSPSFLYGDLHALLDKSFGDGTAKALAPLLGPSAICGDAMTGRAANATSLLGMGAASGEAIWELSDPEKARQALRAVDIAAIRKRIEELELPLGVQFEVAVGKHGETELHRMNWRFKNASMPMLMFAGSQSYLAVEGNYLLQATGTNAERDLKALIDRVRAKQRAPHAHLEAMKRLSEQRNYGFTINLGALKPLFALVTLGERQLAPIMRAVPDKLLLSTAVSMRDEGIYWRGDWPLEEARQIIAAVMEVLQAEELEKELDEEFD